MQINDITSYLYSNEASRLLAQSVGSTDTAKVASETSSTSQFASMLSDEIKNITEFSELSSVIGGSVLGSISDPSAIQALSEDLMSTGSGREVIAKLAEGHLNSIVLDDSDDNNESDSLTSVLSSSYSDAVASTSTVETLLEEVLETLNTANQS